MAAKTLLDTDIWSEILKGKNLTVVERAKAYSFRPGAERHETDD